MTNQEKKEILRQYIPIKEETEKLLDRRRELQSLAEKMTPSYGGVPGGGGGNRMAEAVERMEALDRQLDRMLARRSDCCIRVLFMVESVEDGTLRRLLHLRYIDGRTWEEIAVKMNYSYRQVLRLHGDALTAIKMA